MVEILHTLFHWSGNKMKMLMIVLLLFVGLFLQFGISLPSKVSNSVPRFSIQESAAAHQFRSFENDILSSHKENKKNSNGPHTHSKRSIDNFQPVNDFVVNITKAEYQNVASSNSSKDSIPVDGLVLSLEALKQQIDGQDVAFLTRYSISELFDTLTNIEDNDDEFYWKGRLHKKISNYEPAIKLTEAPGLIEWHGFQLQGEEVFITYFYDHYIRFKRLLNADYNYSSQEFGEESFCKSGNNSVIENIISTSRGVQEENAEFIRKYNHIFGLYWKYFFMKIGKYGKNIDECEDKVKNFYNINKNITTEYDLESLYFDPRIIIRIGADPIVTNVAIFINPLSFKKFGRILNSPEDLIYSFLVDFLSDEDYKKEHEFLHTNTTLNGQDKKLSFQGERLIEAISLKLRKIISEQIEEQIVNDLPKKTRKEERAASNVEKDNYDFPINLENSVNNTIESEENFDTDNVVVIYIQDWSVDSKCDNGVCVKADCDNDVGVYVGFDQDTHLLISDQPVNESF